MAKVTEITEHFQHFVSESQDSFWGDVYGRMRVTWQQFGMKNLYQRGLEGKNLQVIVTDGCPGLAAAIATVYPRALHQRCWVHKMRNILEKVRKSTLRLSTRQTVAEKRRQRIVISPHAGRSLIRPWSDSYSGTCRNC